MKREIYIFLILLSSFLLQGCGEESSIFPLNLSNPTGMAVYPGDNRIKIEFKGNNVEDIFDGYNVYISRTASLRNQTSLMPVRNSSGGIPTITLKDISATAMDASKNIAISFIVEYDGGQNPIENAVTYFIAVRARNIYNEMSEWSNEVETTPRPEGLIDALYSNRGFTFSSPDPQKNMNDTVDMFFIIKKEFGTDQPYIGVQSGVVFQDLGYYQDWRDVNIVPDSGYFESDINLSCELNHVYIFKDRNEKYGKIQIKEIDIVNNFIKVTWSYQTIQNNPYL